MNSIKITAATLFLASFAGAASADSTAEQDPAMTRPLISYHRLYFRAGGAHISWFSKSDEVKLSGIDGPASLAIEDGPIAGSGSDLKPMNIAAVVVGFKLPVLNGRLSLETLIGPPIHVTFRATGTLATMSLAPEALGIPTGVAPLGSEMGEADAAPPMLTAVYRVPGLGRFEPLIGAGGTVLFAYNAHATNPTLLEVSEPKFHIDPGFGFVAQAGFDLRLWKKLYLRGDVKFIAVKAHAVVSNIQVKTPELPLLEVATVGSATMDMWLNPLIMQLGLGADF